MFIHVWLDLCRATERIVCKGLLRDPISVLANYCLATEGHYNTKIFRSSLQPCWQGSFFFYFFFSRSVLKGQRKVNQSLTQRSKHSFFMEKRISLWTRHSMQHSDKIHVTLKSIILSGSIEYTISEDQ